ERPTPLLLPCLYTCLPSLSLLFCPLSPSPFAVALLPVNNCSILSLPLLLVVLCSLVAVNNCSLICHAFLYREQWKRRAQLCTACAVIRQRKQDERQPY